MLLVGYVHDTVYHFEVKENGEVWIHQCNFMAEIDRELMEDGVAETDIKVGMLSFSSGEQKFNSSQEELQEQRV